MALGKKTLQYIEHKFYNYKKIKAAVAEARAEQDAKGGTTGGGNGHSRVSDPTAAVAIKHATPLACVTIKDGIFDRKIYQPEKWLEIMDYTFDMYGDRLEAAMAKRRYWAQESPDFTVDNMGICKGTYYVWRGDLLSQAAYFAASAGLLDPWKTME